MIAIAEREIVMTRARRFFCLVFSRSTASFLLVLALASWAGWRVFRLAVGSPRGELYARWTEGTRVLARDGRLLGERRSSLGLRGRSVRLEDVSPRLVKATITSEDRGFWSHDGVDRMALIRAAVTDVVRWRVVSGGSTLTAQLTKRLDHKGLSHRRTLFVKLREIARAQNLEADTDKRTILEAYLNHLDYGHGLAGPEAAAEGYFGVSARDLSLAQAAFLAVLPRAPSALDPYRHRERAVSRQIALLRAMRAEGEISGEDLERALGEALVLQERDGGKGKRMFAPHVVLAAGRTDSGNVRTTLDFELQRDTEALVENHASLLRARNATNTAVIVIDNDTGDVLAEVGSAGYFDEAISGAVDLVHRRRQAGSTLKPFLYARSFERGRTPMDMLADVPTELGRTGAVYAPDNFDGAFVGPVSAREALAGSLNVPAVRLAAELGSQELVRVLRASGFELQGGAERYGLSLALGSAEVSPWELATAYTTLARGGERLELRDRPASGGGVKEPVRVFEPEAAAEIADALSDPVARIRGLRARGPFEFPYPVALKTGTSTGYRDGWTAGYTRARTVVVWVGNASGAPTLRLTGAAGAGPLFFDVMRRAMRDVASRAPLFDASLLEEAEVCPLSGERAGLACPDRVRRNFARGKVPVATCSVHRHARVHPAREGEPRVMCDPSGPLTIVVLPEVYARFLGGRPTGAPGADPHGYPWFLSSRVAGCEASPESMPRVVLVSPRSGSVFQADEREGEPGRPGSDVVHVVAELHGLPDRTPLDVLVDGAVVSRLAGAHEALVPIGRGDHDIEVRPSDGRVSALLGRAQIRVR